MADDGEYYESHTPWMWGVAGCHRTVTCRDYTSSCSGLTTEPGVGNGVDGSQACALGKTDYGCECDPVEDSGHWEYVPGDPDHPADGGSCQSVFECAGNCCNGITRGGWLNLPGSVKWEEVRKTQQCQGCLGLATDLSGQEPDLSQDAGDACCDAHQNYPADASWIPAAMPSGAAVVVRSYTHYGSDHEGTRESAAVCGFTSPQIKAVVEYAYGIVLANADRLLTAGCQSGALRAYMACMCRRLGNESDKLVIAVEPTGACPGDFGYGGACRDDGSAYFADYDGKAWPDAVSEVGETRLYMGLICDSATKRYGPSTTLRAVQTFYGHSSPATISAKEDAMVELVCLLAHEVFHTCGQRHPAVGRDVLKELDEAFCSELKAALMASQFRFPGHP